VAAVVVVVVALVAAQVVPLALAVAPLPVD
jgi:hypothetical protein